MNRPILVAVFFAAATAVLSAQQASQSNPYQGVSTPPPDDTITTAQPPEAKPPAGHPANTQTKTTAQTQQQAAPAGANDANLPPANGANLPPTNGANLPPTNDANLGPANGDGTDAGIVIVPGSLPQAEPPALTLRAQQAYESDPDGDIVHVPPLGPGELAEGTSIRVELIGDLSSGTAEDGQPFRSRVASDVLGSNNDVVIPAGAEIDGKVVDVSSGHFGGHGSMLLRPEQVIMPNGTTYQLHAMVFSAPDSNTRVGAEGTIAPGSRAKRDSIEYGGVVGGGAVAGAFIGGPVGALAGGLVGAGVVTVHLLESHPQAKLGSGTTLMLTLTERMHLDPETASVKVEGPQIR